MSLFSRVKGAIFKEPKMTSAASSILLNPEGKWRTHQFIVDAEWDNVRLDRLLTKKFQISSALAQKLIRTQKVWVERGGILNRIPSKPSLRTSLADSINISEVFLPERKPHIPLSQIESDDLNRWSLFENDELLVLNKPSGFAVHSGPGLKTSIAELLKRKSPEYRVAHRLDRGTSGVLIVAKRRDVAESLQKAFESSPTVVSQSISAQAPSSLKKTYLALVAGVPKESGGRISTMLYRAKRSQGPGSKFEPQMTAERSKRADLMDDGKVALTDYKVISKHMTKVKDIRVKLSLIEFTPLTGRMHQIRSHAAEQLGCPIVGDFRYGMTKIFNLNQIPGIGRGLHLHCRSISLPTTSQVFQAPLSSHFVRSLNRFPVRIKPAFPGSPIK